MNHMKLIGSAAIAGVIVGTVLVYYLKTSKAVDITPDLSLRAGDATASAEFLNAKKAVEYYRDAIRKKPEVTKNYVELAQIYIQEARVTALHHEYFPKAERLLETALEQDPNDFNALIAKASMLATLHQFEEAEQLARRAITINSYNAFAYGVLVDCLVETGRYDEAVQMCDKMLSIRPDLRSYARAAYLREIHGDIEGAKQAMQMAGEAGVFGQENRAWAFYNLGKLCLNSGELDKAEHIFKGILEERPTYAFAMSGLAQVRSAQEQYDAAIELLQKAWATTPEHTFLEQLADLYKATRKENLATETIEMVLSEFSDHMDEGWNIDSEYAFFCANHDINLEQALAHAERDYRRRPNNIEALDRYAWALFKNGRTSDAVPLIERALHFGTKDACLRYRASVIQRTSGNSARARALLKEAMEINPFLNVLYLNDARQEAAKLNILAAQLDE